MARDKKQHWSDELDRPPTILLAEDDLEMRKLLSWSLGRQGYKIIECVDGISLMKKLGLLGPENGFELHDLVISDIRMPGLTGLQVLENVREFPDFPPMILITAFPDTESRDQAQRLGAVAMLAKPFEIEELLEKVREAIPPESVEQKRQSRQYETVEQTPFPLEITFRHDSGSQAAKDYILDVATKLYPFAEHIVSGKIIIDESDRSKHKEHRYIITTVLSTPGKSIVVKHTTDGGPNNENLYMAINVVLGTAARKLKHYIKKHQERRKRSPRKMPMPDMDEQADE
jgi:CheY-like chemotaxis protein/ribosome-associated translation inhibitor RaiA